MPAGSHQLQLACGSAAAPSDHNQDPGKLEPGECLDGLHLDSMQRQPTPSLQGTASRTWHGVQQLAASDTGLLFGRRSLTREPPCIVLAMLAAQQVCGCCSLVTQAPCTAFAVLAAQQNCEWRTLLT